MALLEILAPFLPPPPARVVAAVSGGSDSVALLHLLAESGADVVVAHLDHGLRPDSATDAQFVAQLASQLGFDCATERVDVASIARKKRQNLEATARTLRYAFLTRVARDKGVNIIFTAHTLNDQAETLLLQLTRGTARAVGIRNVQGRIFRPLLTVSREELLAYLREHQYQWREDPSNADLQFDRNYLRHQVLPRLIERFPSTLLQFDRYARSQQEQHQSLVELSQRAILPDTRWPVPAYRVAPLIQAKPAVGRQALQSILQQHSIPVTSEHLERLLGALNHSPTTLPRGWQAQRYQGSLFLIPPDYSVNVPWRAAQPGEYLRTPAGVIRLVEFLAHQGVPSQLRRGFPVIGYPPEQVQGLWPPSVDDRHMSQALQLARQAALQGEVPVGCVVVQPQGTVGTGYNQVEASQNACAHAEMLALQMAMSKTGQKVLPGSTVYVTLEPCPMCLGALMEAQIARLVFGCDNPKAGAIGVHGMRPAFAVEGGRKERECAKLLSGFFSGLRLRNSS